MATSTVTLDKVYFETLLRKAQFHDPGADLTTSAGLETVTIPKFDHDNLLNLAREYANLRRNLYNGGVTDETLTILINDEMSQNLDPADGLTNQISVDDRSESGAFLSQVARPSAYGSAASHAFAQNYKSYAYGRNENYNPRTGVNGNGNNRQHSDDFSTTVPDIPADGFFDIESGFEHGKRQQYARVAKRTLQIFNLPENPTHAEITNVVRGGMLLDIYLRTNDRSAAVSFLEEDQAHEFFHHVKRNDLYIRGKRVDVRWNERQFILPPHVGSKIAIGATRNIVIRNAISKHTEEVIRDDLEHIHNLVVITVVIRGQNIHISTNSVHNAMFARTCMMSRTTYKGSRIDWDVDECASPLRKVLRVQRKENMPAKKKSPAVINRFELLNIDDGDESSVEGDHDLGGVSYRTPFPANTAGVAV